jgi:uncharacterized membrane protein
MKRVALALVLLLVGGIAGAAFVNLASTFFRPRFPSTLGVPPEEASKMSWGTTSRAPETVEPEPDPVPFTPPPPQVASAPNEPAATVEQTPAPPRAQAKPAIDATEKEVRNLSESRCGGRTMKSITVLPNGDVQVQC